MSKRERYRKTADAKRLHRALGEHIRDMADMAGGATRREVAELLADQPGNREHGKDVDYMESRWVWSPEFVPMLVPTAAVHPVKIASGRTRSRSVGPIVIDINHRGAKQIDANNVKTDFVPPVVIIDGQHRWNDARIDGVKYMHAIVGTLALPEIHTAMIRHEHDTAIPKYSRRYAAVPEGRGKKILLGFEETASKDCRTAGTVCEHCRHFNPDGTKCGLFELLEIIPTVKPDSYCKAFV